MSFSISCSCCGQQVEALDKGFSATTVLVAACDSQKAVGVISYEMRKSAAYAAAVPAEVLRHKDGFVTFG